MTIISLVILSLIIRIFGGIVDGYGLRIPEADSQIWHLLNWMRRDVIIALMYISATRQYLRLNRMVRSESNRRFDIAIAWIVALCLHLLLHHLSYAVGEWLRTN